MDLSLFTAASQSLGVLKTLFDGVVATRDIAKAVEFGNALQTAMGQILALQTQAAALIQANYEFEAKVRDLETAIRKREDLQLHEVRPGAFVYAKKPAVGEDCKPPYFCQPCNGKGVESVLRWFHGSYKDSWDCPNSSEHEITVGMRDRPAFATGPGGSWMG